MNIAPRSVKNGPALRMGLTMVMGRCLSAWKAMYHEAAIRSDLAARSAWLVNESSGMNILASCAHAGLTREMMKNGSTVTSPPAVLIHSTGRTALPVTLIFLQIL